MKAALIRAAGSGVVDRHPSGEPSFMSVLSRSASSVVLAAFACAVLYGAASGDNLRADFCVADNPVEAAVLSGSTLYIGGDFTTLGPATGAGVLLDPATGSLIGGFPQVTGTVYCAAPDGSGGWFIGGSFTRVGGFPRSNLVHILSDKSVAPWDPAPNGSVHDILVSGVVYVCGSVTQIDGQDMVGVAALDASTGHATAWNALMSETVLHLAKSGSTLYLAGPFTSVG